MSETEVRQRQVDESSCTDPACGYCETFIKTGDETYRPTSREEYMAGLQTTYPGGVPESRLPAWALADAR